jgi:sigma-B regulation protein RsbU (phosphoserine phosphatase)
MLKIIWANRTAMERRITADRMARDLALVRDIQAYLLPAAAMHDAGYTLVGKVVPADEAGGDYFDYFRTGQGRIAVAVGDVSGHGAGPALIVSGARAYLRSYCQREGSPAEIFAEINSHLADDMDDDKFMSMFLGVLCPQTHSFQWCNAGHPAPLLVRAGDTVVLYTDGVIELRQDGEEQYGVARLTESICRRASSDARELLDGILADAMKWSGSEHPGQDDVTVAVLRRDQ